MIYCHLTIRDIETLPLHFKFDQWKLFYNDGKELVRVSKKEIFDVIACPQISGEVPPRKNSQTKKQPVHRSTFLCPIPLVVRNLHT